MSHENLWDSAQLFRFLYCSYWDLCAGWNRIPFAAPQLAYIIRKRGVRFSIAPLGHLDAIAMFIDNERFIGLNSTICPTAVNKKGLKETLESLGNRARFVFLHEVAHLIFHSTQKELWSNGALSERAAKRMRWIGEHDIVGRDKTALERVVPAMVREIEADFFALIALVPDFVLLRLDQKGCLSPTRVAKFLCNPGNVRDDDNFEHVVALADYRIALYRKFSHLFREISSSPFEGYDGHKYEKPTMDKVDQAGSLEGYRLEATYRIEDIIKGHPRADSDVIDAIEHGEVEVFQYLRALENIPPGWQLGEAP